VKLLSRDTHPEAQAVQVSIWRRMNPQRKLEVTGAAIRAGFCMNQPEAQAMDPFQIAGEVIEFFEKESIEYLVGGSIASTIHGEPRFTQDVDLVVQLRNEHIPMLQESLGSRFYMSEVALEEAIQRRTCANLIHNATGFKVDLMIFKGRPFDVERFRRKLRIEKENGPFWVSSAEDIILVKLEWYRQGGEVSDRQLRDIHTVLLTQQELDHDYMHRWARKLGVADLLKQILSEHE
jgi:hypothetical protein